MRCYFHLVNSHEEILDDEGVEVTDLESARCQAFAAISELRHEYREMAREISTAG
jgi:hypothetical protein